MWTVKPASRTHRLKRATCGLMPGISAMTTTAGPEPATCTILVTSPSVISRRAKSSRGSSLLRLRFVICLAGFQRLNARRECHGECESEDQGTHPSLAQESRFRQECRSCSVIAKEIMTAELRFTTSGYAGAPLP